ncbi:uncharacterized protein SCDLUD_000041 [Saccharomycodes ludwigii]|uniref:uncharacterized protein n=1 Tax=Saccharomycodes ludwigii TaxID=36035 RepID=UPI001E87AF2C|nr:hypothetical protein SCDLUD_000041 [Saccharomycodes ludwigii]KAH3902464.1 hypothetical protein SCDLUD_000041 [Saccharomycodes ludwigii]
MDRQSNCLSEGIEETKDLFFDAKIKSKTILSLDHLTKNETTKVDEISQIDFRAQIPKYMFKNFKFYIRKKKYKGMTNFEVYKSFSPKVSILNTQELNEELPDFLKDRADVEQYSTEDSEFDQIMDYLDELTKDELLDLAEVYVIVNDFSIFFADISFNLPAKITSCIKLDTFSDKDHEGDKLLVTLDNGELYLYSVNSEGKVDSKLIVNLSFGHNQTARTTWKIRLHPNNKMLAIYQENGKYIRVFNVDLQSRDGQTISLLKNIVMNNHQILNVNFFGKVHVMDASKNFYFLFICTKFDAGANISSFKSIVMEWNLYDSPVYHLSEISEYLTPMGQNITFNENQIISINKQGNLSLYCLEELISASTSNIIKLNMPFDLNLKFIRSGNKSLFQKLREIYLDELIDLRDMFIAATVKGIILLVFFNDEKNLTKYAILTKIKGACDILIYDEDDDDNANMGASKHNFLINTDYGLISKFPIDLNNLQFLTERGFPGVKGFQNVDRKYLKSLSPIYSGFPLSKQIFTVPTKYGPELYSINERNGLTRIYYKREIVNCKNMWSINGDNDAKEYLFKNFNNFFWFELKNDAVIEIIQKTLFLTSKTLNLIIFTDSFVGSKVYIYDSGNFYEYEGFFGSNNKIGALKKCSLIYDDSCLLLLNSIGELYLYSFSSLDDESAAFKIDIPIMSDTTVLNDEKLKDSNLCKEICDYEVFENDKYLYISCITLDGSLYLSTKNWKTELVTNDSASHQLSLVCDIAAKKIDGIFKIKFYKNDNEVTKSNNQEGKLWLFATCYEKVIVFDIFGGLKSTSKCNPNGSIIFPFQDVSFVFNNDIEGKSEQYYVNFMFEDINNKYDYIYALAVDTRNGRTIIKKIKCGDIFSGYEDLGRKAREEDKFANFENGSSFPFNYEILENCTQFTKYFGRMDFNLKIFYNYEKLYLYDKDSFEFYEINIKPLELNTNGMKRYILKCEIDEKGENLMILFNNGFGAFNLDLYNDFNEGCKCSFKKYKTIKYERILLKHLIMNNGMADQDASKSNRSTPMIFSETFNRLVYFQKSKGVGREDDINLYLLNLRTNKISVSGSSNSTSTSNEILKFKNFPKIFMKFPLKKDNEEAIDYMFGNTAITTKEYNYTIKKMSKEFFLSYDDVENKIYIFSLKYGGRKRKDGRLKKICEINEIPFKLQDISIPPNSFPTCNFLEFWICSNENTVQYYRIPLDRKSFFTINAKKPRNTYFIEQHIKGLNDGLRYIEALPCDDDIGLTSKSRCFFRSGNYDIGILEVDKREDVVSKKMGGNIRIEIQTAINFNVENGDISKERQHSYHLWKSLRIIQRVPSDISDSIIRKEQKLKYEYNLYFYIDNVTNSLMCSRYNLINDEFEHLDTDCSILDDEKGNCGDDMKSAIIEYKIENYDRLIIVFGLRKDGTIFITSF